jgi:hypothetical protein
LAGLLRKPRTSQQVIGPDPGSADRAASVYKDVYGELPIPATQFATSVVALKSDYTPSVRTVASDSSVVERANDKDGMRSTGGMQQYTTTTPQVYDPPDSSKFQPILIGPHVNYSQNDKWYIAYPAATVMNGGKHNLAWSEKVPQLPTRTTGGPGPASMRPAPRFKAVQTVPRYSTMPPTYPTASSQG